MTAPPRDPSLLSFLQDRLREDIELVLGDTPLLAVQPTDPEFERRFLDRGGLLHRVRTELAMMSLVVESMQREQGAPPADADSFEGGPVTDLGSEVLKLLAARYENHHDYREQWSSQFQLPRL